MNSNTYSVLSEENIEFSIHNLERVSLHLRLYVLNSQGELTTLAPSDYDSTSILIPPNSVLLIPNDSLGVKFSVVGSGSLVAIAVVSNQPIPSGHVNSLFRNYRDEIFLQNTRQWDRFRVIENLDNLVEDSEILLRDIVLGLQDKMLEEASSTSLSTADFLRIDGRTLVLEVSE